MSAPKNAPKYTPGPWKSVVLRDGARIEADGSSIAWIGPDDTRECADGRIVEVMTKRAVANANLIAATPDLLAAWVAFLSAQATIDSAGFMDNYTDAARAREQQARAIKAARAAIAKAEGRE